MAFGANRYKRGSEEYSVVQKINDFIRTGVPHCEAEHTRCEDGARFVRGKQWSEGDAIAQEEKELPALNLNSIHKLVNAVANREIMDRIVPKVFGMSEEDHGVAEILDLADKWQRGLAETEHEESMAFRMSSSVGYGVMHKWWDQLAMDGEGMVRDEELPIWYMLWDPSSRKQNLVDRKWHICGKYVDYEEAKEVFGDVSKEAKKRFKDIDKFRLAGLDDDWNANASSPASTGTWGQILGNRWLSKTGREVFIAEAEWREVNSYWKVAVPVRLQDYVTLSSDPNAQIQLGMDPEGNPIVMTGAEFSEKPDPEKQQIMNELLSETVVQKFKERSEWEPIKEQYEAVTGMPFEDFRKEKREVVCYGILMDGTLLDYGKRPVGFTYEFLTGFPFETRDGIEFYGMVDVAKSPQDFKNVFYSNLLKYYMTSPKQHLIVEESAVHDIQKFLKEYSGVTGVSFVPDGFIKNQRFEVVKPPQFPPMISDLIKVTEDAVQDIFGLSSIEMNTQGDLRRISGNVVQAAKAASNTLLAILFDALRRYRRRWGLLSIRYISQMYDPSEILKVVGPSKEPYMQGLQPIVEMDSWPDMIKFNIKIDEAPASITEQMETVDYLTRTGTLDKWIERGDLPFDNALDMLVTLPQSLRDSIKAARAEKQQIQAQMQELQDQINQMAKSEELMRKFIGTFPGGSTILAQFDVTYNMAQKMAQEMQTQEQGPIEEMA